MPKSAAINTPAASATSVSVTTARICVLVTVGVSTFFIDVFFVVFFVLFYQIFTKKLILISTLILASFSLLILSVPQLLKEFLPSFKLGEFMSGFSKDQWLKPARFELNKYKSYQIGNLKFNVVKNYPFSFDTPIPAISLEFLKEDLDAGIFPQMISKDLKDGFIWKKLSPEENQKLKLILKDLGY